MKRILILYTEYAPYLHACLEKFSEIYKYEIHVVRYPIDKNAPFHFQKQEGIQFYNRKELNKPALEALYRNLNPDCVLVAGWIDNLYNWLLPKVKNDGKLVIAAVDNLWTASLKQKIFLRIGKLFIDKRFVKIWVPGIYQFDYMRKIGIPADRIMTGFYSANSDLFLSKYRAFTSIPKRFIYVGRLLEIKGTPTLIKAIEIVNESVGEPWEFLIIGSGEYEDDVKKLTEKYHNVLHKPFMQPSELAENLSQGGVFVLPSNYDAWGAVVHEHAMLGFPFILSSMVGSRDYFVVPGYNGFIFQSRNAKSLSDVFKKMMQLDQKSLLEMSRRSNEIGRTVNTESWAARLFDAIQSHFSK